jgi:hypothetical protein
LFDDSFLSDIVEILCSVGVASCAATTEAPHRQKSRRGRIPKEPSDLYEGGSSDAPFPGEVQFFLDFIIAGFSPDELSNDPRLLPSTSQGRSFSLQSHSSVRPFARRGGAGAKRRKSLGFERRTRKRPGSPCMIPQNLQLDSQKHLFNSTSAQRALARSWTSSANLASIRIPSSSKFER